MAPKQRGVHISLRNMTPAVPGNDGERAMLTEDLQSLGCAGLMEQPWNLKNEEFIQQFVLIREGKLERNNMFDTTIRDRPEDRRLEGGLRLPTRRERLGKPDRSLHRG